MIFLQRDYPVTVRTTPSRILYFVTCVAAFMVFAFYTAVLTSYMTAQDAPPTIKVRLFSEKPRSSIILTYYPSSRLFKMRWTEITDSTTGKER